MSLQETTSTCQMPDFEILPGLPPYGPGAIPFSPTGQGSHSEGLVVRFIADDGSSWTGNFQPSWTNCELVSRHPNGTNYIVIAGGQGYRVNPDTPTDWEHFGGQIEQAIEIADLNAILIGNGLWFELIGPNGNLWKSRRISWDGMAELRIDNLELFGRSWSPENRWYDFSLNLVDGAVTGGSYNGPESPGFAT